MFSKVVRKECARHIRQQSSSSRSWLPRRLCKQRQQPVLSASSLKISARSFSGQATASSVPEIDREARRLNTTFNLVDPATMTGRFQLTKIVATIGPTSEQAEPLQKVVEAGMKIMRLNFSHATTEEVELRLKNLAASQDSYDFDGPINAVQDVRATLLDTRGPEIRSGKLSHDDTGHETISLEKGHTITLHTSKDYEEASTVKDLYINYEKLHLCMDPGMKVLLDDGAVILTVTQINDNDGCVVCTVDNSGELRSRAGVNLPGAETDLPAMSDKDRKDIKYGLEIDVDYVAASFIQTAEGVTEIRDYMKECLKEMGLADRPLPLIISKIESQSGLKHFDAILQESDGIMVARGDLGVEIPIQQVTNAQKEMVAACNAVGKPVIVATQMLESMAKNPRPTRAEVSDVTNAVYDGADAVMTSGETAKGKYPDETIKMMNDIILAAEHYAASGSLASLTGSPRANNFSYMGDSDCSVTTVAKEAVVATSDHDCKAILVFSDTRELSSLVAAYRPSCPIISFCSTSKAARQLILTKGVYPVVGLQDIEDGEEKLAIAMKEVERMGFVTKGDSIVTISSESNSTNFKVALV